MVQVVEAMNADVANWISFPQSPVQVTGVQAGTRNSQMP